MNYNISFYCYGHIGDRQTWRWETIPFSFQKIPHRSFRCTQPQEVFHTKPLINQLGNTGIYPHCSNPHRIRTGDLLSDESLGDSIPVHVYHCDSSISKNSAWPIYLGHYPYVDRFYCFILSQYILLQCHYLIRIVLESIRNISMC